MFQGREGMKASIMPSKKAKSLKSLLIYKFYSKHIKGVVVVVLVKWSAWVLSTFTNRIRILLITTNDVFIYCIKYNLN